jgi:hypothetical protein
VVVHHHVEVPDAPRVPEAEDRAVEAPVVDHARIAQRAIAHQHRHPADRVVDDLVPQQHAQRIGARIAVDHERQDRLERPHRRDRVRRLEDGRVDRGDGVAKVAIVVNLGERHARIREVRPWKIQPPEFQIGRGCRRWR